MKTLFFIAHLFGEVKKDGDWYVSCCPPLDVYSQGKTKEEAINNLIEASTLFIESCIKRGTLDEVLRELGFEAYEKPVRGKERKIPKGTIPIEIPIPLLFNERARGNKCPA
ncbi:MAG: type II toxin-antitoxin system HicB family antitoxin [bacterium]